MNFHFFFFKFLENQFDHQYQYHLSSVSFIVPLVGVYVCCEHLSCLFRNHHIFSRVCTSGEKIILPLYANGLS